VSSASPLRSATQRARAELVQARDVRLTGLWAAVAGAAIGAMAVLIKALILQTVSDPGYIVLVAAVIASAWIGGVLGGMVALIVAAGLHVLLLTVDPLASWAPAGSPELFKALFFVGVGTVTVLLIGSRRAAHDRLAGALEHVAALAQQLEARDQRLELVLAASGTGTWEWDMTSGELQWSDAIFRQHGLDPTRAAPSYEVYLSTIHPQDRARFRDARARNRRPSGGSGAVRGRGA